MIDLALFGKSLLLGLAIAAPLGPIGTLCINRTLEKGFAAGVSGGLGTALADALYAALAAIGFAAFSGFLTILDTPLRLIGGAFMLWLGFKSFKIQPTSGAAKVSARDLLGTMLATFTLTVVNPMTILSFTALFAGLGLAANASAAHALLVVAGVFAGSMLWWIILSGGISMARHRLPGKLAVWISRFSGMLLLAFGLWALTTAFV